MKANASASNKKAAAKATADYVAAAKVKDEKAKHSMLEDAKAAKAKQAWENAKDAAERAKGKVDMQKKKVHLWIKAVGTEKKWKVVYKGAVNIRSRPSLNSDILKSKLTD